MSFPPLHRAQVVVLGDLMLDRYHYGDCTRISPEAPVPVVHFARACAQPGGAANVAMNLAAYGAQVILIGICGEDEAAQVLRQSLEARGVTCDFHTLQDYPTIVKLRIVAHQQQLLRIDTERCYPTLTVALRERLAAHLQRDRVLLLTDYAKGTLQHAEHFIALAQEAGMQVLVDPKQRDFRKYRGADLLTPNWREFCTAVEHVPANLSALDQYAKELMHRCAVDYLLITRGAEGMSLFSKEYDQMQHFPARAREIYDVTGAGDTVIATLAAALAVGTPLVAAVELANLAASIAVGKSGTATISMDELTAAYAAVQSPQDGREMVGIVSEDVLRTQIAQARKRGERIVMTNGCFDILHAGHVRYLQQARELGDRLLVAVNDDAAVRRLKGHGRPVNTLADRQWMLAALKVVDWVIGFSEDTPHRLLQSIRPEILVKGGDYDSVDQVVGCEVVHAYGGQVRLLSHFSGYSTSNIIQRSKETD